jgi:hypothetical protein
MSGSGRASLDGWCGFPLSRREGLLVPAAPRRAVVNALGMVDAHSPGRAAAVALAQLGGRLGLGRVVPVRRRLEPTPMAWLEARLGSAAALLPPGTATMAVGRHRERADVLLMDAAGRPLGFLRLSAVPAVRARMEREAAVLALLGPEPAPGVRAPRVLAEGHHEEWGWQLLDPLPDGPHRRPHLTTPQLARIVDGFRERLAALPGGGSAAPGHVPGHGDFTHRNLRRTADGALWLIDWEYAEWMPALADELRYWTAHHAFALLQRPRRAARDIVARLRTRGSDEAIAEAVAWPEFNRPAEAAIRSAVAALVGARAHVRAASES